MNRLDFKEYPGFSPQYCDQIRIYPEIAAAELMSLTVVLQEYVRRGVPNEKADRLRWLNTTCTLSALTEQHTIPLYR